MIVGKSPVAALFFLTFFVHAGSHAQERPGATSDDDPPPIHFATRFFTYNIDIPFGATEYEFVVGQAIRVAGCRPVALDYAASDVPSHWIQAELDVGWDAESYGTELQSINQHHTIESHESRPGVGPIVRTLKDGKNGAMPFSLGVALANGLVAAASELCASEDSPVLRAMDAAERAALMMGRGPSESFGRNQVGTMTHVARWFSAFPPIPGDTFSIRIAELNIGDSAITVFHRPCGIRIETEAVLEPVAGFEECEPGRTVLEPGDSLWAEASAVYRSPPGPGRFEYYFVSRAADRDSLVKGGGGGLGVQDPDDAVVRNNRGPGPLAGAGEKLPYLLRFQDDSNQSIWPREFGRFIEDTWLLPGHAHPIGEATATVYDRYLLVDLALSPDHDYRLSVRWLTGQAGLPPPDPDDAGLEHCSIPSGGSARDPTSLGAEIAFDMIAITALLSLDGCFEPQRRGVQRRPG